MSQPTGLSLPLSLPRRLMADHVAFAGRVPSAVVSRRIALTELTRARASAAPRPSWLALFTKAYGHVAVAWPQLRRAYLPFPTPRLYQHPHSVAALAVERPYGEENAVFHVPIDRPEAHGLLDLDATIRAYKETPLESLPFLRKALRRARWPRPLRRLARWVGLHVSGAWRARSAGTFAITSAGHLGAASPHPLSPLTTALSYGVVGADGTVEVCIAYDPRVLDDFTVARVLLDLERVLEYEVLAELRYFQKLNAA
jgi:hypothetical protein